MGHRIQKRGTGGGGLLVALGLELIACLPQIIDYGHDLASRMMERDFRLDIRLGKLSISFGRASEDALASGEGYA